MFTSLSPATRIGMVIAAHFLPGFDLKAQKAFEERDAIAEAIARAFTHPKEFFKSVTKAHAAKGKDFAGYLKQQSLSGNFHAGVIMGGWWKNGSCTWTRTETSPRPSFLRTEHEQA